MRRCFGGPVLRWAGASASEARDGRNGDEGGFHVSRFTHHASRFTPSLFHETYRRGRCWLAKVDRMSAELDPDAALMLRVKEGDVSAFTELVDKYKQPVMNLVYRMLHDATEAEDLAQNVFVQVYRSASRYRVSSKFSNWLFTIARNLC